MANNFGKTWWGEHWLRSLDNIDYDNRLPRGASYARSGHVKDVKIKENQIIAKVAGSRPSPYKVNLIVPPFFEEQVEQLMIKIIERPVLISKLLNRELDPEILTIAEQVGLKVFPKQWTDFKMQCSCPDWAVPCKHLAAFIYMVSREIDNNPFLVFEIHKVNLIEELKKRGIFIAQQKKAEIVQFAGLLKGHKSKKEDFDTETVYQRIDFSQLQNIAEPIVQLLPDAPPFYHSGNFKEKYAQRFGRNSRDANRLLTKKLDFDAIFFTKNTTQPLNTRSTIGVLVDTNGKSQIRGENHNCKEVNQLIPLLFELNPDHLSDFQPSVAALHRVLYSALHLLANGAVVPQIIQLENKSFAVRWLPAMIDNRVKQLLGKLSPLLPPDLLLVSQLARKTEQALPVESRASELLSIFISALVSQLSKSSVGDIFTDLFFLSKPNEFKGVGENALSGGIKVWLDRYFLTSETYKPVITVTELYDESFQVEISIEDTSNSEKLPVPLSMILTQPEYEKQRFKILQPLSLLSPFIRGLDTCINLQGAQPILFDSKEFAPFLMEMLPAIRLLDITILLPKSLQQLLRPKASVKLTRNQEESGSFIRLDDLLLFDWQVAIGDQVMSPEEYKKLIKNAAGLIRFKESYIYVNESDLEKLHRQFTETKPMNAYQLLQTALCEEYEGSPVILTNEVRKMIQELTSSENIQLPNGLNAQLRPYQLRGYSWMYRNSRIGFGSIIADDMGLGKTLQVISILLKFKEEKVLNDKHKALVVVPTGLLTNWQLEIEKFAPSLSSHIHHGTGRDLRAFEADVMLTTYGVVRSDADLLKKHKWQVMIIDEAQNIKNHEAAQSKAVKSIGAQIRIAMSGTPVENRLTEFWSIMDFSNKGYLGTVKTFKEEYAQPIQVFSDEQVVQRFRKVTAPFMMRRMKNDKSIISDLPDKIEQNQFSVLSKPQAILYEKTMQLAMEEIEGISSSDHESLFKRQGLVLQMILALKQICNHPTQFLKNGKFDASLSGKTELLLELLESIVESGEKVLIFTQFREMGELLERFIEERFGEKPMFYHGGSNVKQRQQMVERFQNNRADKIFLLSLKAAGTGLNLTAASHVIHYDLWWNPAVENQATDRAYRIGQNKNVMVHRFITKNTFEERIDEMIQKKKHLADMTVATGENWIGKLSNKELREIFG
jgi:uncharacterized Zn finger protein/ERCC4-related helicase